MPLKTAAPQTASLRQKGRGLLGMGLALVKTVTVRTPFGSPPWFLAELSYSSTATVMTQRLHKPLEYSVWGGGTHRKGALLPLDPADRLSVGLCVATGRNQAFQAGHCLNAVYESSMGLAASKKNWISPAKLHSEHR